MQFTFSFVVAAALALAGTAAPSGTLSIQRVAGEKQAGSYIVRLKPGADKSQLFTNSRLRAGVVHADWTVINGFAGKFDDATLDKLRASDLVESISEDGIVRAAAVE
jgi:cerevisin